MDTKTLHVPDVRIYCTAAYTMWTAEWPGAKADDICSRQERHEDVHEAHCSALRRSSKKNRGGCQSGVASSIVETRFRCAVYPTGGLGMCTGREFGWRLLVRECSCLSWAATRAGDLLKTSCSSKAAAVHANDECPGLSQGLGGRQQVYCTKLSRVWDVRAQNSSSCKCASRADTSTLGIRLNNTKRVQLYQNYKVPWRLMPSAAGPGRFLGATPGPPKPEKVASVLARLICFFGGVWNSVRASIRTLIQLAACA